MVRSDVFIFPHLSHDDDSSDHIRSMQSLYLHRWLISMDSCILRLKSCLQPFASSAPGGVSSHAQEASPVLVRGYRLVSPLRGRDNVLD